MKRRLLRPSEAAEILSVSVRTLYAWRIAGEGPPVVKVGKYLRYDEAELERWIDAQASELRRPA